MSGVVRKSGLERLQDLVAGLVPMGGLPALLGLRPVSAVRGRVELAGDPAPAHYNSGQTAHGGYVTTLLDTAMGTAAQTMLEAGQGCTTLELKIAFHRPVTEATGTVTATGVVIRAGRRVIFTEATLTDAAGQVLASGSSTLLVV